MSALEEEVNKTPLIEFHCGNTWVMKIENNKISFNREYFPEVAEDGFADAVLKILERAELIQIPRDKITKWKDISPHIPEYKPEFQEIAKLMRINADILMKEITEHVDKELERFKNEMEEIRG